MKRHSRFFHFFEDELTVISMRWRRLREKQRVFVPVRIPYSKAQVHKRWVGRTSVLGFFPPPLPRSTTATDLSMTRLQNTTNNGTPRRIAVAYVSRTDKKPIHRSSPTMFTYTSVSTRSYARGIQYIRCREEHLLQVQYIGVSVTEVASKIYNKVGQGEYWTGTVMVSMRWWRPSLKGKQWYSTNGLTPYFLFYFTKKDTALLLGYDE
jgi:hypothetical protein